MVFIIKKVMGMFPCKNPCKLKRMQKATKTPNKAKKYPSGPLFAQRFEFDIFIGNNEALQKLTTIGNL